jgi:hypothetical protein
MACQLPEGPYTFLAYCTMRPLASLARQVQLVACRARMAASASAWVEKSTKPYSRLRHWLRAVHLAGVVHHLRAGAGAG